MDDIISRQAAQEEIARRDTTDGTIKVFSGREVNEILASLPSAQTERPRGWFIEELIPYEGRRSITCSECGKELSSGPEVGVNYFRRGWRYCPYCGAQMGAEVEE